MDILMLLGCLVLLAIVSSIVYIIVIIIGAPKKNDLLNSIYQNSERKVLKALNNREFMTIKELLEVIKEKRTTLFYRRYRILVKDSKAFLQSVLVDMMEKDMISEEVIEGNKIYKSNHQKFTIKR